MPWYISTSSRPDYIPSFDVNSSSIHHHPPIDMRSYDRFQQKNDSKHIYVSEKNNLFISMVYVYFSTRVPLKNNHHNSAFHRWNSGLKVLQRCSLLLWQICGPLSWLVSMVVTFVLLPAAYGNEPAKVVARSMRRSG